MYGDRIAKDSGMSNKGLQLLLNYLQQQQQLRFKVRDVLVFVFLFGGTNIIYII